MKHVECIDKSKLGYFNTVVANCIIFTAFSLPYKVEENEALPNLNCLLNKIFVYAWLEKNKLKQEEKEVA